MKSFFSVFSLFFLVFVLTFSLSAQELRIADDYTPVPYPSNTEDYFTIHYDGDNVTGIGAPNATFVVAAKFTNAQLGAYIGGQLEKVRFYIHNPTVGNSAKILIYGPGTASVPGAVLHEQVVTITPTSWNEFTLTNFVNITGNDLWVAYEATAGPDGTQFFGGADAGPQHPNGQFVRFNNEWTTLVGLNPALTRNWNIRAIINFVVPVELSAFSASVDKGIVTLNWETATELNNNGFEVQRKIDNNEFHTIGFVKGNGTTTEKQNYTFTDKNVTSGSFSYRLKQIDFDGRFEYSHEVEVDIVPSVYALEQNFPNPFNPSTSIAFSLASDASVVMTVYNLLGQEVAVIVNGTLNAGQHSILFDASNLNSGLYFYRIDVSGVDGSSFSSIKKMMLTK